METIDGLLLNQKVLWASIALAVSVYGVPFLLSMAGKSFFKMTE